MAKLNSEVVLSGVFIGFKIRRRMVELQAAPTFGLAFTITERRFKRTIWASMFSKAVAYGQAAFYKFDCQFFGRAKLLLSLRDQSPRRLSGSFALPENYLPGAA